MMTEPDVPAMVLEDGALTVPSSASHLTPPLEVPRTLRSFAIASGDGVGSWALEPELELAAGDRVLYLHAPGRPELHVLRLAPTGEWYAAVLVDLEAGTRSTLPPPPPRTVTPNRAARRRQQREERKRGRDPVPRGRHRRT